ncbi:hypothetical protein FW755_09340 [Lonepinella koalarum]|uniref:hypothetical protein n=1 Tax=Lonepinella koalarum TaxID=53417 RepID=UPI0011E48346|nr:hypothetical protein [Lonepinella koalarum]TYG35280.1 hypothetical protein FW755_09340 [Lonepinella koalarum]
MTILQDYFDNKLVEAGFPSGLKIEYSLSHCQGDGMAFYGDLALDDLVRLFNKMNTSVSDKEQRRFQFLVEYTVDNTLDATVSIRRNHWGYHYSHYNSMSLEYPIGKYLQLSNIRSKDRPILQNMWDTFIEQLEQYIKDTSQELEALGYQIIDSTYIEPSATKEEFNTKNYRIEFKIEPIQFYANWCAEEFGYEDVNELCNAAMNGKKFVDLTVIIYQKELGIKMSESSLGYCSYGDRDKSYAGNKRYLIHEAIREARSFAQLASKAAQHLRPITIN